MENIRKGVSVGVWTRLFVSSFVPVSFLPVIFPQHTRAFVSQHKVLTAYFFLLSCFFRGDNERLMFATFLPYYVLIAEIVQKEFRHKSDVGILDT